MNRQGQKLNIPTIIAVAVVAAALLGIVITLVAGRGFGSEQSTVSKKEIQNARTQAEETSSGEAVSVVGLDDDIVITSSGSSTGASSSSNNNSGSTVGSTQTNSEYVFPNSDTQYLTDSDVSGLSKSELRIARNEIMARHGRIFDSSDLKAYFEGKSWYKGTVSPEEFDKNVDGRLNQVERANIEMIKKYE